MKFITHEQVKRAIQWREDEENKYKDDPMAGDAPFDWPDELNLLLYMTRKYLGLFEIDADIIPTNVSETKYKGILERLSVYGIDGRYVDAYGDVDISSNEILESDLYQLGNLLGWVPREWLELTYEESTALQMENLPYGYYGALEIIYGISHARYLLDTGKDLTVLDVSLLVDMPLMKSVLNATQEKRFGDKRLIVEEDEGQSVWEGKVLNANARTWLNNRPKKFIPTDISSSSSMTEENLPLEIDEYVMVPVSEDGISFLPSDDFFNEKYEIKRGEEVLKYDNYFEALEMLNSLRVPRWRVQSNKPGGYRRMIEGKTWERIQKSELKISNKKNRGRGDSLNKIFGGE